MLKSERGKEKEKKERQRVIRKDATEREREKRRQRKKEREKGTWKKKERAREGDAICSSLSLAVELGESFHPIIHIAASQAESPFNFKTFLVLIHFILPPLEKKKLM